MAANQTSSGDEQKAQRGSRTRLGWDKVSSSTDYYESSILGLARDLSFVANSGWILGKEMGKLPIYYRRGGALAIGGIINAGLNPSA